MRRPLKTYTSAEDAKLRSMAKAGHSTNEIAAAIHRSSGSVYKRARVLDIRLAAEFTRLTRHATETQLADAFSRLVRKMSHEPVA